MFDEKTPIYESENLLCHPRIRAESSKPSESPKRRLSKPLEHESDLS